MDFSKLIERLQARLQGPLPGPDAQANMMPYLRTRQQYAVQEHPNAQQGGVMVLLYPQSNGIYLPLMQRPTYPGAHSGQVSFPGGKAEPEDGSLIQTALRETEEEIGVPAQQIEVIGNLSELYIEASNFKVLPTVGVLRHTPAFVPEPHEVVEVIPAAIDRLLQESTIKTTTLTVGQGFELETPYYDIGGKVVWGATAMMLAEFKVLLQEL